MGEHDHNGDADEIASWAGDDELQEARDRVEADRVREHVEKVAGGVSRWLEEQSGEGVQRGTSSRQSSGGSSLPETTAVAYAVAELTDLSKRVERISKQQLAARFRRARVVRGAERRGGTTRMLQYSLIGSRTVLDLEHADGIYDELNAEKRIASQVVARTAIGKTTRFPSRIAVRCNRRVLLVEPDVRLARMAADAQRGMVKVRTPWMTARTSVLTTMSYADFCGHFRGQNGIDMLERFDVVMFDEAHLERHDVIAAKSLMATFAKNTSLLVCSATVEGEDAQSTGVSVATQYTEKTLRELTDAGHLVKGVCCKDRTLVIAIDDQEAQYVASSIAASGFEVRLLDSASNNSDVKRVQQFLEDEGAVVNRYLVVVREFGWGYNFPVGNVITGARRRSYRVVQNGTVLEEVTDVCSKQEVVQNCNRAGRGIVKNATALVCALYDNIPDKEVMPPSEVLRYYVTMVASGVVPVKSLADSVRNLLPFGLTARVASDLLAINLPIEVAIRFFADDGRVPLKYTQALAAFSEDNHEFMASEFDEPHAYDTWVVEPMSGYYGALDENMPGLSVPCRATGGVKVAIHSVCAAAMGLMTVEDWRPQFDDSEGSDDDVAPRPRGTLSAAYVPRLITDRSPVRSVQHSLPNPYQYGVPYEKQFAQRSRLAMHGDYVTPGTLKGLAALDVDVTREDFNVSCEVTEFHEGDVKRVGIIHSPQAAAASPVDVHSPGGSVVMAFRAVVWQQLVEGKALSGSDALSFFHSIKNNVEGFVGSDAFSGWTDVWFSVFRTAASSDNLRIVKKNNYTSRVVALLLAMVTRYANAVREVSKTSAVKSSFFQTMLRGQLSYEEVYKKQSSRGRAEIAQSEAFVRRVFDIRDEMAEALMEAEEASVFAPGVVTQLQQMLPLMKKTGIGVVDEPAHSRRYVRRLGF